jgi:hypothetical protein
MPPVAAALEMMLRPVIAALRHSMSLEIPSVQWAVHRCGDESDVVIDAKLWRRRIAKPDDDEPRGRLDVDALA